ncbi:MAG: phage head completion protein [Caulobacter sp.]
MAWTPPDPGALRDAVRFERRPTLTGDGDGAGNFESDDWAVLISHRSCRLLPQRGGEQVQAARLGGVDVWELVCRSDSATRAVVVGDRAVDERDPRRSWNIRSVLDLEGRGRWLVMTIERGGADG